MALKKAVKQESKLRMAILGPAGSGKTYSALKIAKTLAGDKPVALFDTEHASAAKYATDFDFDTDNITAPFHPDKFCTAIREAVAGGYGVVILDSLSHAWNGEGGMLDIVEQIARRMKNPNSFAAWKDATPIQNRLTEAIVGADIHIIVTMRSKVEYILQDDGKGRQVPRKVGMAPIQRENYDYEFDVVMEMDASDNTGVITKSRCSALTNGVFKKPGENVAKILVDWLQGAPVEQPTAQIQQSEPDTSQPTNGTAPTFTSAGDAVDWGYAQGCFNARPHAQNTYDELKREKKPKSAQEMFALWTAEVQRRVVETQQERATNPVKEIEAELRSLEAQEMERTGDRLFA